MLVHRNNLSALNKLPIRQNGVVLLIALIVLVAMTLAGIALVRSVDTTNIIAGNLAFQQAATHSADTGIETAIKWLETNNNAKLDATDTTRGYAAAFVNPDVGKTGAAYWSALLPSSGACILPIDTAGNCSAAGTPDAAGNTVSYMIQRLCNATGNRNGANCATSVTAVSATGINEGAGEDNLTKSTAVYYQITVRVDGPRNTVSYVQAIVYL